jgi:hypothetical protein
LLPCPSRAEASLLIVAYSGNAMAWRVLVGRCRGMVIVLPWPPDRPAQRRAGSASGARGGVVVLAGWGEQRVKRLAEPLDLVEDRGPGAAQGGRVALPGRLGAEQQVAVPAAAPVLGTLPASQASEASLASHRCTTRGSVSPAASQRLRASPICLLTQMA